MKSCFAAVLRWRELTMSIPPLDFPQRQLKHALEIKRKRLRTLMRKVSLAQEHAHDRLSRAAMMGEDTCHESSLEYQNLAQSSAIDVGDEA